MIKVLSLVNKRKDLTLQEFKDYWLTHHSPLEKKAVETAPVREVLVSFSTGEVIGGERPNFDGMVEFYFDTPKDLRASLTGPF